MWPTCAYPLIRPMDLRQSSLHNEIADSRDLTVGWSQFCKSAVHEPDGETRTDLSQSLARLRTRLSRAVSPVDPHDHAPEASGSTTPRESAAVDEERDANCRQLDTPLRAHEPHEYRESQSYTCSAGMIAWFYRPPGRPATPTLPNLPHQSGHVGPRSKVPQISVFVLYTTTYTCRIRAWLSPGNLHPDTRRASAML